MKKITRRQFILVMGAAVSHIMMVQGFSGQRRFPLEYVSAFYGPFIVDKLEPGLQFDTKYRGNKLSVYFRGYILGWLPQNIPSKLKKKLKREEAGVKLHSVDINSEGRLELSVKIM